MRNHWLALFPGQSRRYDASKMMGSRPWLWPRDVISHVTIRLPGIDWPWPVTMRLSSTVTEIWPFEILSGRLFQEQRSVVGRSLVGPQYYKLRLRHSTTLPWGVSDPYLTQCVLDPRAYLQIPSSKSIKQSEQNAWMQQMTNWLYDAEMCTYGWNHFHYSQNKALIYNTLVWLCQLTIK